MMKQRINASNKRRRRGQRGRENLFLRRKGSGITSLRSLDVKPK
jgi:hypothetical protein